ncbi:hypothetical protein ACVHNB_32770 [Streptomyces sp. YJ-C3]
MIESRSGGEQPPGRYHLTLTIDGKRIADGWWDDPDIADGKFTSFRREHVDNAGAHVLLTEWDDGKEWTLREWPTPQASEGA